MQDQGKDVRLGIPIWGLQRSPKSTLYILISLEQILTCWGSLDSENRDYIYIIGDRDYQGEIIKWWYLETFIHKDCIHGQAFGFQVGNGIYRKEIITPPLTILAPDRSPFLTDI